ncbi:hypothetical protein [Streptomyces sp. NPDC088785]|uniref:hypothetical protein n=1 Tax=Streptomyces sp. NPDC088785 TaxID=3365897 RepID=UPI00382BF864
MAATDNWRCGDCDTFNVPAETTCAVCGGTRRAPAPAPAPRPAVKRPAPARPAGAWRCTRCDTNNTGDDTACLVCGAGRRSAAKPAARRKGPAKRATGRPAPRRSAPGPRAESLFHPPPTTAAGYVPTASPAPPTVPAAPPPVRRPRAAPAPRRPAKSAGGCGGCLIALAVGGALLFGAQHYFASHDSGTGGADGPAATGACPARVADALSSGGGAELVDAYRTENKQITLCRTTAGALYYYGEFSDHREAGIAMRATRTSDGYEATNGPYRYVVHGDLVTIYQSGEKIGEETVTPDPSPR